MENKIKLRKQDVARYYWIDDVTFIVEFNNVPQYLLILYECKADEEYLLYGEYWEEDDSFHYIISCEDDYVVVNEHIDKFTDWVIRELSALEEE